LGDLPKEQQLQLGGYIAPNGKYVDIGWMLTTIDRFEKDFGRRPSSGLEIVEWIADRSPTLNSVDDLTTLSPEAMPKWFYKFVNPQTGKLYRSFDGSVPEPGGVKFRDFVNAEDCKRAFAGRPGADHFTKPNCVGGCEVIVYDKDPSKVLDTATTLKTIDLEPQLGAEKIVGEVGKDTITPTKMARFKTIPTHTDLDVRAFLR
jgi:hypothetical protein